MIHTFKYLGDIDLTVPIRRATDPKEVRDLQSTLIFALSMLEHAYAEVATKEDLSRLHAEQGFSIDWGHCRDGYVPNSLYLLLNTKYGVPTTDAGIFDSGPNIRRYLATWFGLGDNVIPVKNYPTNED